MMYEDDAIWKDHKLITDEDMKNIKQLGAKHDTGKLQFGCLTRGLACVLRALAAVLTYGAQKYSRDSWQDVPNGRQRYEDAFDRHWNDYQMGIKADYESGLHPLLHVIINGMFVMWFVMKQDDEGRDYTHYNKVEKK